jgi:hypothetical protein
MAGGLGDFLDFYVYPLAGLGFMLLGLWFTWGLWKPGRGTRNQVPGLAPRLAAVILGCVWGWILANLPYSPDPSHVILGFPMPVMALAKVSGKWLELGTTASIPCLFLDLAIGIGMVHALLHFLWKWQRRRRPRPRAVFHDTWRVARPDVISRARKRPVDRRTTGRHLPSALPSYGHGAEGKVPARRARREPAEYALEDLYQRPVN